MGSRLQNTDDLDEKALLELQSSVIDAMLERATRSTRHYRSQHREPLVWGTRVDADSGSPELGLVFLQLTLPPPATKSERNALCRLAIDRLRYRWMLNIQNPGEAWKPASRMFTELREKMGAAFVPGFSHGNLSTSVAVEDVPALIGWFVYEADRVSWHIHQIWNGDE